MGEEKSVADRLLEFVSPGPSGSDRRYLDTPESWRPIADVDTTSGGYMVSRPRKEDQDENLEEIFNDFKLDSSKWVVSSLRRSRWQTFNGEWLEATRVNLLPITYSKSLELDLEELVDELKKWRPRKRSIPIDSELGYVFCASDQQIGKKGNGQGTQSTIDRLMLGTELGLERLSELRKLGRKTSTTVIALLGDHVEGNVSQGGRLQSNYASDLGLPQQIRVARRVLTSQIKAFAEVSSKVLVPVVNGNHDEVTRQVSVDPADGWNTEIASAVQDALRENELFSHVEFRFPESDHQTLAVNVHGTMLGLFHGHQIKSGNASKYISEQAGGKTSLGACDVFISGHFHHYDSKDIGPRFWAQCPTTDPGSAWFRDSRGMDSQAGVLTMLIGEGHSAKRDLSVLDTPR